MENAKSETRLFGVMGSPIAHSFSPVMQNIFADYFGHKNFYVPFLVEKENLKQKLDEAYSHGFDGLNITVPLKVEAVKFLNSVSPVAKKAGAVNTIKPEKNGFIGFNTDVSGLIRAIKRHKKTLKNKRVLIYGAGGAARAAAVAACEEGAKQVYIINRSLNRAKALAAYLSGLYSTELRAFDSDFFKEEYSPEIIIQATSLGLSGNLGCPLKNKSLLMSGAALVEMIYSPEKTELYAMAEGLGTEVIGGFDMLFYQGLRSYEIWNGLTISEYDENALYHIVKNAFDKRKNTLQSTKNIVLTGFMGSGKTTVGKELSFIASRRFFDTDGLIEEKENMSINEIFISRGETAFRELEALAVSAVSKEETAVISTGGGAVLNDENSKALSQNGILFFLDSTPEEIIKNTQGSSRPLLNQKNRAEEVRRLLLERRPSYIKNCRSIISTKGKTPRDIAVEILKCMEEML